MATYDKEKNFPLHLTGINKSELRTIAKQDGRSSNNFINLAIDEKIERMNKID